MKAKKCKQGDTLVLYSLNAFLYAYIGGTYVCMHKARRLDTHRHLFGYQGLLLYSLRPLLHVDRYAVASLCPRERERERDMDRQRDNVLEYAVTKCIVDGTLKCQFRQNK